MLRQKKEFFLLISFLYLILTAGYGQNQKVADSLAIIYSKGSLNIADKLELLRNLSFNEVKDLNLSLRYAEELIDLSVKSGNDLYLHRGYFQKGNKKRLFGDLEEALKAYLMSADAAEKAKYDKGVGNAYGAIADTYSVSNDHQNSAIYFARAIVALRKSNDSIALASAILNSGEDLLKNKNYKAALVQFQESELIFEKVNYPAGKAYSLGNIGIVNTKLKLNDMAEKNLNEAIRVLTELEDYYPICVYLLAICDIYHEKGENTTALDYAQKSLVLAQQNGLKEQIKDANLKLSELYGKSGNHEKSLFHYKEYITFRDSISNIKSVQAMANMRTDFEVAQKQSEVDLLHIQKRKQQIIIGFIGVLLLSLFWYYKTISREKKRSELLLLNILPHEIAKELKLNGKVDAIKFDEVTVLKRFVKM